MRRRLVIGTVFLLIGAASCRESTSPLGDGGSAKSQIVMEATVPRVAVGATFSDVAVLPTVRVYDFINHHPVKGALVRFTLRGTDGEATTTVPVTTRTDGTATLPGWRLGSTFGRYKAIAEVAGAPPVDFSVLVKGPILAIYDLTSIDGQKLPVGTVSNGHIVLFQGGFYSYFYNQVVEKDSQITGVNGAYKEPYMGAIDFYVEPANFSNSGIYASSNFRFASGFLSGKTMTVAYVNYIDFGEETYALRE